MAQRAPFDSSKDNETICTHACDALIDVVGMLTIERHNGDGLDAKVARASLDLLAEVHFMIAVIRSRAWEVDWIASNHLVAAVGFLQIEVNVGGGGSSPRVLEELCERLAEVHSLVRGAMLRPGLAKTNLGSGTYAPGEISAELGHLATRSA